MNDISLKSDKGKYEIVLRSLDKGVVIINILERNHIGLVEEAIDIAKKYNPKKIYLSSPFELPDFKEYRKDLLYKLEYTLTKSYKEIKMHEAMITDREDLISLINYKMDIASKPIDQADALDLIKGYKCYFFSYKDKRVGCVVFDNNDIKYFTCNNIFAYDMCLSKALYKNGCNTSILISSLENTKINKFRDMGFVLDGVYKNYYEV